LFFDAGREIKNSDDESDATQKWKRTEVDSWGSLVVSDSKCDGLEEDLKSAFKLPMLNNNHEKVPTTFPEPCPDHS
jgi:hypothetical protein